MGVIASWKQYRDAPKLRDAFDDKLAKINTAYFRQKMKHNDNEDLIQVNKEKLNDLHNQEKINPSIDHINLVNQGYTQLSRSHNKSVKILKVQDELERLYNKQLMKQQELEQNPFIKTDKFIRAHQTPIKAAIGVPVTGLAVYGGKKVIDNLTTPVVTAKPAPTVAPTALPPAAPPNVKPPPNHFSDNASKYGVALGGVAAAGLGALALRRYIKKKKDK